MQRTQLFTLKELEGINSISFTSTSNKIILSAYQHGQPNLFEYNMNTKSLVQITDDYYEEHNCIPFESANERGFLFLSNNPSDTFFYKNIEKQKNDFQKLFYVSETELNKMKYNNLANYVAISLPNFHQSQIKNIQQGENNTILYTCNESGIQNIYQTKIENGKFTNPIQLTNYNTNILSTNRKIVIANEVDSLILAKNHFLKIEDDENKKRSPYLTQFFQYENKQKRAMKKEKEENQSKFKQSEKSLFNPFEADSNELKKYSDSLEIEQTFSEKNAKKYSINLTSDYVSAQLDNSLFINKYQPYQYNQGQFHQPILGGLAKYTFSDIFEDHKTTLGFRMPSTGKGSDFFYEYDHYKTRIDWGFSYFRHIEKFSLQRDTSWLTQGGIFQPSNIKQKTHYIEVRAMYPFSKFQAVKLTIAFRKDKQIYTATDTYSLTYPDTSQMWIMTRMEWLLNKRKTIDKYIQKGFNSKVFIEYHTELSAEKKSFINLGATLIHYLPIYKQLIWANRFQGSVSGGKSDGMLFVLGGVQNQLAPKVDSTVIFSNKDSYQYMNYIGGLRGFAQNIRVGNSFALLNSELRFPLMPLIKITTPFTSINTLQFVLFTDLANTWNPERIKNSIAIGYGAGIRTNLVGYYVRLDCAFRNLHQTNFNNPLIHIAIGKDW